MAQIDKHQVANTPFATNPSDPWIGCWCHRHPCVLVIEQTREQEDPSDLPWIPDSIRIRCAMHDLIEIYSMVDAEQSRSTPQGRIGTFAFGPAPAEFWAGRSGAPPGLHRRRFVAVSHSQTRQHRDLRFSMSRVRVGCVRERNSWQTFPALQTFPTAEPYYRPHQSLHPRVFGACCWSLEISLNSVSSYFRVFSVVDLLCRRQHPLLAAWRCRLSEISWSFASSSFPSFWMRPFQNLCCHPLHTF
mmetsp:Transcript_27886/g.64601  ORF Transcript_27886/g.64601 Transcript_27886/m.64601 type:complete len:245 (+) Transcript_27886:845-1579(+)